MKRYVEEKDEENKKKKSDKKNKESKGSTIKKDLGLSESAKILME